MHLDLINIDQFCEELPEVDNHKYLESGRFAKSGLFSQQIFGPIKSFYCACSKGGYRGRNSTEDACFTCEVDICSSEERRKRFGKITLPFKVLNPVFYYIICQSKPTYKSVIQNMIAYKHAYYFNDNDELIKIDSSGNVEGDLAFNEDGTPLLDEEGVHTRVLLEVDKLEGLSGILRLMEWVIEKNDSKAEMQFLRDHFNQATVNNVVVIPPDFRPYGKNQSGVSVSDEINQYYSFLIVRSNHMKNTPYNVRETDDVFRTNFKHVQNAVLKLHDYVLSKLSKKKGLIRANLLGKRVDFSGRAIISPDPTLSIDSCRIPFFMLLELQKPQLVTYMVRKRLCKRYNQANALIDECIRTKDTQLFDLVSEFCEDKVCILNRQPTLHRLGVLAFKCSTHLGNTIQIHPMMCYPYNADFDGDAMAIYFPITELAKKDTIEKLGIWNNLISPTDLTLVPLPNQDIILGIWDATSSTNEEKREIKGKEVPVEVYLFNKCLPDDYPLQTKPCDKKRLISLLNDIAFKYPPKAVMNTLDKIKRLGFMMTTLTGYSLGIDDLYDERLEKIAQNLTGDKDVDLLTMDNDETMNVLKQLPFAAFINSGARGNWKQMKQLVLSRGYVSDQTGKIRNDLIRGSFIHGLNQSEFCKSSWGARKGLLDTAMSTGDSGYLTRQLVYSTVCIELDMNLDDCGTTETLDINVVDKKLAKTLLWRYHIVNDQLKRITRNNYSDLVGKIINLRSPVYCKSKKICKTCYGHLYRILHSNQVGIIATQTIGERATQLVLRTFHESGVASVSSTGSTDNSEDIVSGMAIANKLFHSPEKLRTIPPEPKDLAVMIHDLFNPYKGIHMIHYEIIVSAMMMTNKGNWRTLEDRNNVKWKWTSILKIPALSSWLLGAAFSNVRHKLLDGVIRNRIDDPSSITNLFRL